MVFLNDVAVQGVDPAKQLHDLCDLRVEDTIVVITDLTAAAAYYDARHEATLLDFLAGELQPDMIILDGMSGIRQPSLLKDGLVFFNETDFAKVLEHMENVSRDRQVKWLFEQILDVQRGVFERVRAKLPNVPITFNADNGANAGTGERLLRVILQAHTVKVEIGKKAMQQRLKRFEALLDGDSGRPTDDRKELEDKLKKLRVQLAEFQRHGKEKLIGETETAIEEITAEVQARKQGLRVALARLEAERAAMKGVRGASKRRKDLDAELKALRERIAVTEERIAVVKQRIQEMSKRASQSREPKTSPLYQAFVARHVRHFYDRLRALCHDFDIDLITTPSVVTAGDTSVAFAYNSLGTTWTPVPAKAKRLAESYAEVVEEHRENVAAYLRRVGARATNLHFVFEAGHGVGFARHQRVGLTDSELRMDHVGTLHVEETPQPYVTYVSGPGFENQDKIGAFTRRERPARTAGNKMQGSTADPVIQRYQKGAVSGLTILRRHRHDVRSVEFILYRLFETGAVLEPFRAVMVPTTSDVHLGSGEHDLVAVLGAHELSRYYRKHPLLLYGQEVYAEASADLGDAGESDTKRWQFDDKPAPNMPEILEKMADEFAGMDVTSYDEILAQMMRQGNRMMKNSMENMEHVARLVDWHLFNMLRAVWDGTSTGLRDVLFFVTGNHYDNRLGGTGWHEDSLFVYRMHRLAKLHKEFPELGTTPVALDVIEGAGRDNERELPKEPFVRVTTGGYSVLRQAIWPEFGLDAGGQLMINELCRIVGVHDPGKFLGSALNARAHFAWRGHVHENTVEVVKAGEGSGRFLDTTSTLTRPDATGQKYGGLVRQMGMDLKIISSPNRHMKLYVPSDHLRLIGIARKRADAKKSVAKAKSKKRGRKGGD